MGFTLTPMIRRPSNALRALRQRVYPDPIGPGYAEVPPGKLPPEWAPGGVWTWYEAKQNWSKSAAGQLYGQCRVKCHPVVDGFPDTDIDTCIYLRTPFDASNHVLYGHPNVVTGQWIQVARCTDDGHLYCIGHYLDGTIGRDTLDWHGPIAEIPAGWQFCDGSNDPQGNPVPDYRGRQPVYYYGVDGLPADDLRGAEGDYDEIGQTIDRWKVTLAHDPHSHDLQRCTYGETGGGQLVAYQPTTEAATVTTHGDVDLRGSRIVIGKRIRVPNWVVYDAE